MQEKWFDTLEIGQECFECFVDHNRAPELAELEISISGKSLLVGHYLVARSNPDHHGVIYSVDGGVRLHTEEGVRDIGKFQLITLPAGKPYILELKEQSWNMVWFHLNRCEKWDQYCYQRPRVEYCDSGQQIYFLMCLIFHEPNPSMRRPAIRQLALYLSQTLENQSKINHDKQRLELLFSELEQKLHYPWVVQEMADLTQYSASHLHRVFVNHYHVSPMQYLIKLRMERAKYLLSDTDWSIEQIAEQVGYSDIFNFSKRFKKSIGITPSQFRKTAKISAQEKINKA